jgi:Holliday junction resolvase-like predicted endonuclease
MNFQSESKRSGDEFEDKVLKDLKLRGFSLIQKNIYIPRTGCEVDFLTYKGDNPWSSGLPV